MGYIRKRIKQPTTWLGIAAAAFAMVSSGGAITPEVTASLLAALGLVQVDEDKRGPTQ